MKSQWCLRFVLFVFLLAGSFICEGSRLEVARQVQYYKSSGEIENAVVELSQVMSETGIPITWQKWYFAQRAKRARKQGNTIVADVYDKFVRTLQTEYDTFK